MNLAPYIGLFLLAFLGSGHCLGMCGGFAVMLGQGAPHRKKLLIYYSAYQAGKTLTYIFLGIFASVAGSWLLQAPWMAPLQRVLAILAGGMMAVYGINLISGRRFSSKWFRSPRFTRACSGILGLLHLRSSGSAFLFGWLNGFLPCGLVMMALVYMATLNQPLAGFWGGLAFGLGTYPALGMVALSQKVLGLKPRLWLLRSAGVFLVLFGVMTSLRWHDSIHHWFHMHTLVESKTFDAEFEKAQEAALLENPEFEHAEWCDPDDGFSEKEAPVNEESEPPSGE